MIRLDARPSSDLDWDLSSQEHCYHLDFGWDEVPLDPYDEAHFNACVLAVEEFGKKIKTPCEVALLVSDGQFELPAQVLSEYLHRLASFLPDEVTPLLVLAIDEPFDFSELVIRLCRRRFEHFKLKFTKKVIPIEGEARTGVSLPADDCYDTIRFNAYFDQLEEGSYICIPEEFLNEHWDGLDQILYDPELISDTGRRMLLGFEAAGGKTKGLASASPIKSE